MLRYGIGLSVACCLLSAHAKEDAADAQNNFNDKYMKSYLPPGDEHYTDSWVGQNSSWRKYMSYAGKSGDYQKYLEQYGGPQANYDQYVSLYASMAGADVTSGKHYQGKGKSQLNAWNKSMMTTYNLYIPGPYENFAEQATEERTESGGQGVGQGTMGEGHGGGGGGGSGEHGGGEMPWMPKSGGKHQEGSSSEKTPQGSGAGEVGYEPFARPWVVRYATDGGGKNAFDYEGKEFAGGGMQMGGVQDYVEYMNQYAGDWVPTATESEAKDDKKSDSAKAAMLLEAEEPAHPAQPALPRLRVKDFDTSTEVPHPAQPALPQMSKMSKEALAEAQRAVKRLQQAAKDESYAAWSSKKHLAPLEQSLEQKQLAEEMSRLWKVTRQPMDVQSLKELQDAGRAASQAIARLRDAEMQQLQRHAKAARKILVKGAKDWSQQVQAAAQQEDEALGEEAREAGQQLEKSLVLALSSWVEHRAEELRGRAEQRKQLLQGVLGEAVDLAKMAPAEPKEEASKAPPVLLSERQSADRLKAVPGTWLLFAMTLAGLLYCVVGYLVRRSASRAREPREIALLTIGEP